MKIILVCCGSGGVATSPQVANKINDFLADKELDDVVQAEPHPVETAKSRIETNPNIIVYVALRQQMMIYVKLLKKIMLLKL
nr:hypothetical protein [Liquorilactobacillus satsumensis]